MLFRKKKSLDTDAPAERAEADISYASNPYLHGREEWLERYGSYIARASQWRRAATALMLICVLSLALNLFQASQATVIPYYVSVDELGRPAAA